MRSTLAGMACLLLLSALVAKSPPLELLAEQHLKPILAVGPEGKGNAAASEAWDKLVKMKRPALVPTLKAFKGANPFAVNWLRLAVDAIAEAELAKPNSADVRAELEQFVARTDESPLARRLAYEWLCQADPKAPDRLLPGMILDPSVDLRRDAIAADLGKVPAVLKASPEAALKRLKELFDASRDADQAEAIRGHLLTLKEPVDLAEHFGCLTKWMIAGPFDGGMASGYETKYTPQDKIDLKATYPGKAGKTVAWTSWWSFHDYGSVNLHNAIGKIKNATAFAYTVVNSSRELQAELRFGTPNAVRAYVNGKEVFAREEYHHGQRQDQYVAPVTLVQGDNVVLLMLSQNNQTEPWAQDWSFQARLCDATGGKLPLTVVVPD